MHVVLVHGIFDTGAVFDRLVAELTREGHVCHVPTLTPSDARHGLADLGAKLAAFVDGEIDPDEPIAIVGFSMGALVARYYLQHLGGCGRTKAFFSISGPHEGSLTAYLHFGQGARDLRPGSDFLGALDASAGCLAGLSIVAYWTPMDVSVFPAASGRWPLAGEVVRVPSLLHQFMPSDATVCADIVERLSRL